jgi:hypothetical protein
MNRAHPLCPFVRCLKCPIIEREWSAREYYIAQLRAGRITQQCCSTSCARALRTADIRRHMKEQESTQQASIVLDSRTRKSNLKKAQKV